LQDLVRIFAADKVLLCLVCLNSHRHSIEWVLFDNLAFDCCGKELPRAATTTTYRILAEFLVILQPPPKVKGICRSNAPELSRRTKELHQVAFNLLQQLNGPWLQFRSASDVLGNELRQRTRMPWLHQSRSFQLGVQCVS
jgi:hypothetical protein